MLALQLDSYRELFNQEITEEKIEEFCNYIGKLERLAEVTAKYRETVEDDYSTYGEQEFALEKLEEAFEEYQMFLGNTQHLNTN